MDTKQLVKAANDSVERGSRLVLNMDTCRRLSLSYVAQWLANQDELTLSAAKKAAEAVGILNDQWRE